VECPLPVSTITTTAPDYARGFRVQRPRNLVDALWELDVPVTSDEEASSVDEADAGPPKRARLEATGAQPKAAASSGRPRTAHVDAALSTLSAMQPTTTTMLAGTDDEPELLNVWGLLDSMDE